MGNEKYIQNSVATEWVMRYDKNNAAMENDGRT